MNQDRFIAISVGPVSISIEADYSVSSIAAFFEGSKDALKSSTNLGVEADQTAFASQLYGAAPVAPPC